MKPAPFRYERPTSVRDVLELVADDTLDARVLAGGQSLVPLMAMRLSRPDVLVDLNRVGSLRGIGVVDDVFRIGAMTRQSEAENHPLTAASLPVLSAVLQRIGHIATRHRGTIGGSIAHADPAAELVAFATLVDATCVVQNLGAVRCVPAATFFEGYFTTAIEPGEILVELQIELSEMPRHFAIAEFSRRAGDFAMAGVIVMFDLDGPIVRRPRIVAFAAGPTPIRGYDAELMLEGQELTDASAAAAGAALADSCSPSGDIHGSVGYRRDLIATLAARALLGARERSAR